MGRSRRLTDRAARLSVLRAMDDLIHPRPATELDVRDFTVYLAGERVSWPTVDELRRPYPVILVAELGRATARVAFAEWVTTVSPRLPPSGASEAP